MSQTEPVAEFNESFSEPGATAPPWTEVAGALDVTLEDVLPEATQDELLTLTGDIAHNVVRLAVPLSSYLIGVAVGRGASAEEAIRIVGGLLPAGEG